MNRVPFQSLMVWGFLVRLALGVTGAGSVAASHAASPADHAVNWVHDPAALAQASVEVVGPAFQVDSPASRMAILPDLWPAILSVRVESAEDPGAADLPALAGSWACCESNRLRFKPQFPLEPGLSYRAILHGDRLPGEAGRRVGAKSAVFSMPAVRLASTNRVTAVYPSASLLPANLLKFYVHFSAPMSRGRIYEHIHLRDTAGSDVDLPFLELDEALWSPDMTRLTLFIDPGRIKRGVKPLEDVGPALESGKSYTLEIDRTWLDANGAPLAGSFRKTFKVIPADRGVVDPDRWRLVAPRAGSMDALRVGFTTPMDHALALRMIRVAAGGRAVPGNPALRDEEREWLFTPDRPWEAGSHALLVQSLIEDLAGNNVGKPFDVDALESGASSPPTSVVRRDFTVR